MNKITILALDENIITEMNRQHISTAEMCIALGITDTEFRRLIALPNDSNGELMHYISDISALLDCSTDYLLGSDLNAHHPDSHDDKMIGYTPAKRIEKLFDKLGNSDNGNELQLKLLDIVCDFCADNGVIFTRVDGKNHREQMLHEIICTLASMHK